MTRGRRYRLENCVCCFRLGLTRADGSVVPVQLNLRKIFRLTLHVWSMKYDPALFGSANMRFEFRSLGLKNLAALIFSTGQVVCPGASTPSSGLIMAHAITYELTIVLGVPFCVRSFRVTNRVMRVLGDPVDVRIMADVLGSGKATYEPSGDTPFPACFVFPHNDALAPDKIVYLVFESGKVVITGCRSHEDAMRNVREVLELTKRFAKAPFEISSRRAPTIADVDRARIRGTKRRAVPTDGVAAKVPRLESDFAGR